MVPKRYDDQRDLSLIGNGEDWRDDILLHGTGGRLAPVNHCKRARSKIACHDRIAVSSYFSVAMATMVGDKGTVIAVDLQQEMLDIMRKREILGYARAAGLRINGAPQIRFSRAVLLS